jgi:hypothetical protein
MAWQGTVEPDWVYEHWDYVARMLDPADGFTPTPNLPGAVHATLSLLSARQSVWAAVCLTAGHASRTDREAGFLTVELALADPERWPSSELTEFCERYDNLGWPSATLISAAKLISASVPLPMISAVAGDMGTVEQCMRLHNGDKAAVMACLREARAVLAEPAA